MASNLFSKGSRLSKHFVRNSRLKDIVAPSSAFQFLRASTSNAQKLDMVVQVNGKEVHLGEHHSVLDACRAAGVHVPTVCNHPRLKAVGTCRLCLVDVDGGKGRLAPACVTQAYEGMKIETDTDEVRKTVKGNLELMLAKHPHACMTCHSSGACEFQDLVYEYEVEDKWPVGEFHHEWDDHSSHAIVRDMDKCISCGRCIRACGQIQGMNILGWAARGGHAHAATVMDRELSDTECIECGQCASYCPVGAITERDDHTAVLDHLKHKEKINIIQTAPAPRVALGEELGMEPGQVTDGQLVAALRELGFDYVFDTNFTADLTIMEEGSELLQRLETGGPFPMMTSCCPGWVTLVEKCYPQYIPNLSTAKSPQQMLGALTKTYFAKKLNKDPSELNVVSLMPCTAKKQESHREEMGRDGYRDVDHVITTRELARMIKLRKIAYHSIGESKPDEPMGIHTGAAQLFGVTGGVMEAALRTAYEIKTGETLPKLEFEAVRGLDGVKEAVIPIPQIGLNLRVCVVNGTGNIRHLMEKLEAGEVQYDFIEAMACPGGCIGGGGQPKSKDPMVLKKRMNAIYNMDGVATVRKSHENTAVKQLYDEFLGQPLGEKSHHLLHTHYHDRSKH